MKKFFIFFIIVLVLVKLLIPLISLNIYKEESEVISLNHTWLVQKLLKQAQKERENEKKAPISQIHLKDIPSKLSDPLSLNLPEILVLNSELICHKDNVKLFNLLFSVFTPPKN